MAHRTRSTSVPPVITSPLAREEATMHKLTTIRSHAGHAQFLAELSEQPAGYLPRHLLPAPSPYMHTAAHAVWRHLETGQNVMALETSHRVYEVWQIDDWALYP